MNDLGAPIAYLALERGTPVFDAAGERVGPVDEVLGDESADIFDGIVISAGPLHSHHLVADETQIAGIYERGVRLSVGRAELREDPDS
jgi:uncharacterized protein YrrD